VKLFWLGDAMGERALGSIGPIRPLARWRKKAARDRIFPCHGDRVRAC